MSYQKAKDKMGIRKPQISIIILDVNGLKSPIKKCRVADWIKKQNSTICCLQETHLSSKDKYRLKVKGWKMIFEVNSIQRKVRVAKLLLAKNPSKSKR